jgi:hypothetical protein
MPALAPIRLRLCIALFLAEVLIFPAASRAQASGLPSAAPVSSLPAGLTSDQRGRLLLQQMVTALGGDAWLNRATMQADGRGTSFFHGEPNPYVSDYHEYLRFARPKANPPVTFAERVGFFTPRGMIMPGKKIDVIQITLDRKGYEVTYKGKTEPPQKLVDDVNRRRDHSLERHGHGRAHPLRQGHRAHRQ